MTEIFRFFNSAPGDERWHYASDFADYFGSVLSSGLISNKNESVGLQVTVNSGTLTTNVAIGKAIIKGYSYENTQPITLTHGIPEQTMDRIDRIVLRLDLRNSARFIKVFVKEGVSATTPIPPVLQRDTNVYELSLAKVTVRKNSASIVVSDIVDERANEELCGIVQSLITVPTSVFQQQFTAWFNSVTEVTEQEVSDWQMTQEQAFTTWFNDIKGQLDGDVGANLANQIATHKLDNVSHNTFATCLTTSTISEKIIVATGFNLVVGSRITVKFTNANTATTINLNINSTGSKPVKNTDGSDFVEALANGVYEFIYDGTSFIALNNGGGGSGGDYIYNGLTEPTKKDGIWVKDVNKIESVEFGSFDTFTTIAKLPSTLASSTSVAIGTNAYIFGGRNSSSSLDMTNTCYKYDSITNTFTTIAKLPSTLASSTSVAIGTNVYIFGGINASGETKNTCYKYDSITNTFTTIANLPSTLANSTSVAIGTNVYIFGGKNAGVVSNICYKYNSITNTFTTIANLPINLVDSTSVAIGTDAYIFGGQNSSIITESYKYDTLNNTFTPITKLPSSLSYHRAVALGANVYLFDRDVCYKYNSLTGVYTTIEKLVIPVLLTTAVPLGNHVYLFGGQAGTVTNTCMVYGPFLDSRNRLSISTAVLGHSITLAKNKKIRLKSAYFNEAEVYYGDGASWKLFN